MCASPLFLPSLPFPSSSSTLSPSSSIPVPSTSNSRHNFLRCGSLPHNLHTSTSVAVPLPVLGTPPFWDMSIDNVLPLRIPNTSLPTALLSLWSAPPFSLHHSPLPYTSTAPTCSPATPLSTLSQLQFPSFYIGGPCAQTSHTFCTSYLPCTL